VGCLFGLSVLLNILFFVIVGGLFLVILAGISADDLDTRLREKFHSGTVSSHNKVAIIEIDGILFEGAIDFPRKQIEQAMKDEHVKAVVVRINSPGGSITASDELHRRLTELVQGKDDHPARPAVVSMGALAASGGYYVAMPCKPLYAEPTTLTGSIGVFASFPNVKELGDKIGFKMETVQAGAVKTAGSPFKEMTPQERQLWQDMVDHAYDQFLDVVRKGRPDIKDELKEVVIRKTITVRDKEGTVKEEPYVRTRVDGGIFTADQAEKFKLIDKIGYLEDAIKDAAAQAGLGSDYQAVKYERPKSLAERLLGVQSAQQSAALDPSRLSAAAVPRLWYLAPQSELAGILTAAGRP
jgi:protease-4